MPGVVFNQGTRLNTRGQRLHTVEYLPEGHPPRALLFFQHGYGEHIGRYRSGEQTCLLLRTLRVLPASAAVPARSTGTALREWGLDQRARRLFGLQGRTVEAPRSRRLASCTAGGWRPSH